MHEENFGGSVKKFALFPLVQERMNKYLNPGAKNRITAVEATVVQLMNKAASPNRAVID